VPSSHPIHVSDADVQFWEDEGYFVYQHPLFPQAKFEELAAYFEQMLADLPPGARPEAMDVPHFAHPKLFDWLLADEVLDFVERFVGPDIALWSSHFICKPAGDGKAVPWHEDSAYWSGRLDEQNVLTVWLAVDASTTENGCMRVVPRTHHYGFSEYEPVDRETNVFGTRIKPDQFDEGSAVDLELRRGECHIHHAKLIHASNANTSAKRRCGYTMRYMPTSVKLFPRDNFPHAIYLARGRDIAGNQYGEPFQVFEPGVRAIYRR